MKKTHSHAYARLRFATIAAAVVIILFAMAALFLGQRLLSVCGFVAGLALMIYTLIVIHGRSAEVSGHIIKVSENNELISENMLESLPLPLAVCAADGSIRWYNDRFAQIFSARELRDGMLDECIRELKWSEVLKTPGGKVVYSEIGESIFAVTWRMIKDTTQKSENEYTVYVYMKDITDEETLKQAYENERVDIAIINIDNYDEFQQRINDDVVESTSSKLRAVISEWARESSAVLKKTDRDRYFAVFEHQHLKKYTDKNFEIIGKITAIADEVKFPLSISIGIGTGGNLSENEISARNALDLALGRGGGQVCIKDETKFRFFGGKSGEYERSSRVKARAVASALTELIKNSDRVIFMGHRGADYDCFGAAVGLQRAVRELGKVPYIVHDSMSPAVDNMYRLLDADETYDGLFVGEMDVQECVTPDTLLVVLDTHRPSMLPCPELLERVSRIVLIDHHRRSTEFISPVSLVYHEPYASSTCEMVTELLEYMNVGNSITKLEAQCLYSGIVVDTKNFMLKTGVRTFEAASYLRRLGLDTVAVRRMFSTSAKDYAMKADIVKSAVMVSQNTAVAKTYTSDRKMRQIASAAADDMLNLENVAASVVVYPADGGTGFSARSIGTVNVQLIMERLGGGGHMTVAGAFIPGIGVDEGVKRAEAAVRAYIEDTKN